MKENTPDFEDKNLTRLIVAGVLIGFFVAGMIFGIQSLIKSIRTPPASPSQADSVIASPTRIQMTSSPLQGGQPISSTITLTPVQFQFDQEWAAVGDPAPYFTLSALDGQEISLEQFKGRPVIINFWASWCEPCGMEMPFLQETFLKYEGMGLMVLGVNDSEKDTREDVETFLKEHPVTFPILLDGAESDAAISYGVHGLPASFFIDSDGILRRVQIGAMTTDVIEKYTREILP